MKGYGKFSVGRDFTDLTCAEPFRGHHILSCSAIILTTSMPHDTLCHLCSTNAVNSHKVTLQNMSEEWESVEHALRYLGGADAMPHRTEGESALLEEICPEAERVLDIGAGDGRLLDLCLLGRIKGVRYIFSYTSSAILKSVGLIYQRRKVHGSFATD